MSEYIKVVMRLVLCVDQIFTQVFGVMNELFSFFIFLLIYYHKGT